MEGLGVTYVGVCWSGGALAGSLLWYLNCVVRMSHSGSCVVSACTRTHCARVLVSSYSALWARVSPPRTPFVFPLPVLVYLPHLA